MTGVMHDPGISANFRYTTSTDMTIVGFDVDHEPWDADALLSQPPTAYASPGPARHEP